MRDSWLQALGTMVYGIYLLTTSHKQQINGMIASWVSQVSYDPVMIMAAVHQNRYSRHLIQQSGVFALHLLSQNQTDLLGRFKGPDPEAKFGDVQWFRGKTGCPILKDCLGYMECVVKASLAPGNHTLFFGEVLNAQLFSGKSPLSTVAYEGFYVGKD